jgi:hypothetical protein
MEAIIWRLVAVCPRAWLETARRKECVENCLGPLLVLSLHALTVTQVIGSPVTMYIGGKGTPPYSRIVGADGGMVSNLCLQPYGG